MLTGVKLLQDDKFVFSVALGKLGSNTWTFGNRIAFTNKLINNRVGEKGEAVGR